MAATTAMKPLSEALAIEQIDQGSFRTFAHSDYCYGDWAFGGFLASLLQIASVKYSVVSNRKYPHHDVLNLQIQFLRPVLSAQIDITAKTVTVTQTISTVHVSLSQKGKDCVVGYVNLVHLDGTKGASFDTNWDLHPPAAPANIAELETNASANWIRYATPYSKRGWFRLQSLVYFLLPIHLPHPSIADEWITPTDSRNRFTNDTLGVVADLWAPFFENYNPDSTVKHARLIEIARQQKSSPCGQSELSAVLQREGWTSPFILTTVSMTLEVKKSLPAGGVKWLYVRAYAKAIKDGKFDVEVVIMDEQLQLVALSHQVALVAKFEADRRDSSRFEQKAKF